MTTPSNTDAGGATQRSGTACARRGALAPAFTLPDARLPKGAEPTRLRAWRQRRAVLVALLPGEAPEEERVAWLRALAARRAELAEAQVVTLVVAEGARDAAHALWRRVDTPYPLLADADGATLASYLGAAPATSAPRRPTLALVDRYSVLIGLLPPTPDGQPDLNAALRDLAFAEQEDCACGLPAWPEGE